MYFDLIDKLKGHMDTDPIINTTTKGDIFKVDLSKQSIFPLCHIIVNDATLNENVISYSISIIAMDIVDFSKEEGDGFVGSDFIGNNNEDFVLNTMLQVLTRAYEMLRRGDLHTDLFQVDGTPTCEPFTDRFENVLAGWTMNLTINVPNGMSIC